MQIGDTVSYYDEKGNEFPAVLDKLEQFAEIVTVKLKDGTEINGVPKITQRNIKPNGTYGPCYDPRPKPQK